MTCPLCGYEMSPFDEECQRCAQKAYEIPPPPPLPPPSFGTAPPTAPTPAGAVCQNCGMILTPNVAYCTHCGAPVQPVWPPPSTQYSGPKQPLWLAEKLITGNRLADTILGFVVTFLSMWVAGIGLIVMPILYVALRPNYPAFARGIGLSLLTMGLIFATVVLGALYLCSHGFRL